MSTSVTDNDGLLLLTRLHANVAAPTLEEENKLLCFSLALTLSGFVFVLFFIEIANSTMKQNKTKNTCLKLSIWLHCKKGWWKKVIKSFI